MPLPERLHDYHKANAGIVCYHNAVCQLIGGEVPVSFTLTQRDRGFNAARAAEEWRSKAATMEDGQLLAEAWEFILEMPEPTDAGLQNTRAGWLDRMNRKYGKGK